MPSITQIDQETDHNRYAVFIDGVPYYVSDRSFPAMGLTIGDQITPEQLQYLDNRYRELSNPDSCGVETRSLDCAEDMIHCADKRAHVIRVGYGQFTLQFIPEHPDELGSPDLVVVFDDEVIDDPNDRTILTRIKTSGIEAKSGDDYWIRHEAIHYVCSHPDEDTWIVFYCALPNEEMVCIWPNPKREYVPETKVERAVARQFVIFSADDPEVFTVDDFADWLRSKMDRLLQSEG